MMDHGQSMDLFLSTKTKKFNKKLIKKNKIIEKRNFIDLK